MSTTTRRTSKSFEDLEDPVGLREEIVPALGGRGDADRRMT
jgi:hypothetical protein